MDADPPPLDPARILRALSDRGVRYVVIGGFAGLFHGSAHLTFDLDITPERTDQNLARLSDALRDLDARVRHRGAEVPLPFNHDARSLGAVEMWNLRTDHGDLDVSFCPSGTQGYDDLHRDAIDTTVLGIRVEMAALADVVRSKEAAGRPKDQLALPTLRRLLDEQQRKD